MWTRAYQVYVLRSFFSRKLALMPLTFLIQVTGIRYSKNDKARQVSPTVQKSKRTNTMAETTNDCIARALISSISYPSTRETPIHSTPLPFLIPHKNTPSSSGVGRCKSSLHGRRMSKCARTCPRCSPQEGMRLAILSTMQLRYMHSSATHAFSGMP